jgi:hypothetical protein
MLGGSKVRKRRSKAGIIRKRKKRFMILKRDKRQSSCLSLKTYMTSTSLELHHREENGFPR